MRDRGLADDEIRKLQRILRSHRESGGRLSEYPTTDGPEEDWCDECESRITITPSYGEVGHEPLCPERERNYRGRAGRRQHSTEAITGD